ncbi:MAG TPA: DUF4129 domain-containing protein [Nocardioides sp.]|nr:DUF4129 domain-containing protein [Nocardioides sp.]
MRASRDVSPAVRAVVTVAATSLFMVLVAWATILGPDQVFTGPGPSTGPSSEPTRTCIPAPTPGADGTIVEPDPQGLPVCEEPGASVQETRDFVEDNPPPLWLKVLTSILLGAVLVGVTALVLYLLAEVVRQARARRADQDVRTAVEFDVLDAAVRVSESIALDADEQDALLRAGEPRNAIVAAWHRFEVQGERAGVARRSSETSSEFAIRVLDLVEADTAPVNALAELYREARFSDHPMGEEHRDRAITALGAIRRSLAVRA